MSDAFQAFWASVVRTIVPVIVGAVVGWFTTAGIQIDPQLQIALGTLLTTIASGLYYIIVRLLETYVTPKFGWLLLFPKAPVVYSPTAATKITDAVTAANDVVKTASDSVEAGDTPPQNNTPSNGSVG